MFAQVLKLINKVKQTRYNFTLVSVTDTRVKLYRICLTLLIIFKTCDPPRENRYKGDDTGTCVITWHAKRDI